MDELNRIEFILKELSDFTNDLKTGKVKPDIKELTSKFLLLSALVVIMNGRIGKLEATIDKLRSL